MTGFSASSLTPLRPGDPALFRVADPDAGSLIVAMPANESDISLRRLENEYALRERLDVSWAAVPQSLQRHNERNVVVLSDPGGKPLREQCAAPWSLDRFLVVAQQLARTTQAMHEQHIVHRNLTPDDILFDDETGHIAFCGFGYAALIGTPSHAAPKPMAFAYMAPEVAGGLTRTVETSADLYALGCIFYELLAARPPFDETNELSWVHAQMARLPAPLDRAKPALPRVVVDLVTRLLEKQAALRYRCASSLLADLDACVRMLGAGDPRDARLLNLSLLNLTHRGARNDNVPIAYGRDQPLAALNTAYKRAQLGEAAALMLVSGHAGIGKTALIAAFRAGLVPSRMAFAASKSDRANRQVPFAALTEILQSLLRPMLGEPETVFNAWRDALHVALGSAAGLLARLIPDLRAVVGDMPATALPARKEHEALLQAVVNFILACRRPDRPVVLFLDDLQWADLETLEVIRALLNTPGNHSVLVVGTYRSNEVDASHPLTMALIEHVGDVSEIKLDPLGTADLVELVRERYRAEPAAAFSFAQLLQEKTLGNPFFVHQFLIDLERDGFVDMAPDCQGCRWDLAAIHSRHFTDNVTELLVMRLNALPVATLPILCLLACMGVRSSTQRLAFVAGMTPHEIRSALRKAVELDCVRMEADEYVFWHDRVQEATYATLSAAERTSMHLAIGRKLAQSLPLDDLDDSVFAAVGQINLAAAGLSSRRERYHFAQLNLAAALKAKSVTAHASALNYLGAAALLLGRDESNDLAEDPADGLADRVAFATAECEFLTNAFERAESRLDTLARADIDPVLRADVTRLQAALYTALDRPDVAMQVGFDYLTRIGMSVPIRPTDEDVRQAYETLLLALNGRAPAELIDQPMLTDGVRKGTLNVLADLIPPALFIDVNLMDLLVLRMAIESIQHGHTDSCAYAYVTIMFISGTRFNDFTLGYEFAKLAIDLVELRGLTAYKARTYIGFGLYVLPWHGRVRDGQRYIREAFDVAMQTGDITFALYCRRNLVSIMIVSGAPLSEMRREALRALEFAKATGFQLVIDAVRAQLALINTLTGYSSTQTGDSSVRDVTQIAPQYVNAAAAGHDSGDDIGFGTSPDDYPFEHSNRTIAEFSFWTHRLQACVVFGDIDAALIAQAHAEPISWSSRAFVEIADFRFYAALAHAAALRNSEEHERAAHQSALTQHRTILENWAAHNPPNFAGRSMLVAAETARAAGGDSLSIGRAFEAAVKHAQEQGFAHDEALANELAANYYTDNGLEAVARTYLRSARSCYAFWGAHAKVAQLDRHPLLIGQAQSNPGINDSRSEATPQLDTVVIVKASNALSSEIVPQRVVETLMATALAMAGAQTGVLMLAAELGLNVAARATLQDGEVKVDVRSHPLDADQVPMSLIQTVSRTLHTVVLDDASRDPTFSQDPCFRKREPRSVFCMPLIKQSRLIAILYLENDLTAGAFVPARTSVLEVLASQAAIALENARLYADLLEESRQRTTAQDALRDAQAELERAARLTTMGELVASIVHEVTQPINAIGTSAGAALRWLDRDIPDLDESKQMLAQIVGDSARAKAVIQSLRQMAKKSSPTMEQFDIHGAIREVLALTRTQLHDISVELDDSTASSPCEVLGDRVQIQQVVLNLIMNAAEAMTEVAVRRGILRIGTTIMADGMIEVYVGDNGKGLDAQDAGHLFQPFFSTKPNGMGMGLVICRSIIEAHGGRLGVSSAGEFGTVVRFTVRPRAAGSE